MKRGENLQRLVYTLERAINNDRTVQMASPQRFRDKVTKKPREHDVAITFNLHHHKIVLVIECRDRTRPVGVPDVEAFKKKCDRTGVDRGVIVSSTGFANSALTVAAAEDIGCMSLEDVERFNWCQVPAIERMTRRFVEGPLLHIDFPRPFEGDAKLYDGKDQIVTESMAQNIASQCLNARLPEQAFVEDGRALEAPVACKFDNDGAPAFYLINKDGQRVPLTRMIIAFAYRTERTWIPLRFHQYVDLAKGTPITGAAIAELGHGDISGNVIMHQQPDGRIVVSFVPRPLAEKAQSLLDSAKAKPSSEKRRRPPKKARPGSKRA